MSVPKSYLFKQISYTKPTHTEPGKTDFISDINVYLVTEGYFRYDFANLVDELAINKIYNQIVDKVYPNGTCTYKDCIYCSTLLSKMHPPELLEIQEGDDLEKEISSNSFTQYYILTCKFRIKIILCYDLFDLSEIIKNYKSYKNTVVAFSIDVSLNIFKKLETFLVEDTNNMDRRTRSKEENELHLEFDYFIRFCALKNIIKKLNIYNNKNLVVGKHNYDDLIACSELQSYIGPLNIKIFETATGVQEPVDISEEFKSYNHFHSLFNSLFLGSHGSGIVKKALGPYLTPRYTYSAWFTPGTNIIFLSPLFWNSEYAKSAKIPKLKDKTHLSKEYISNNLAHEIGHFMKGISHEGLEDKYPDNTLLAQYLVKMSEQDLETILRNNWDSNIQFL